MPLAQQNVLPIWGWSMLLIALVVGLFVVIWWMRRRTMGAQDGPIGAQPFTLAELRELRDSGAITPEQFHKLREHVVGAARSPNPTRE